MPATTEAPVRFHLPILFALAALVHGLVIANSSLTARDSLGFARLAINLAHPERSEWGTRPELLRNTQQPPGYSLAILAVDVAIQPLWKGPQGERLLLAAQLASGLAGVLIVFPLYRLACRVLPSSRAFVAVAIYNFLPAVAKYTSDGLSESWFLLFAVTALWLGIRMLQSADWKVAFGAGIVTGCAYLVRPEGLGIGLAIVSMCVGLGIVQKRMRWMLLACSFALGVAIPAGPYMAVIGGVTNKPAAKELLVSSNTEAPALIRMPLFAEFLPTDAMKDSFSRTAWCAKAAGIEFLRATHFAVGILAFIALCLFAKTLVREPAWCLLLAYGALHLTFAGVLAFRHGYISDRHLLPVVPFVVLLAMKALEGMPRCWPWVATLIAISCVPSLLKPLHENRVGHKHAGRFLAGALGERDALIDPFEWESFYAGRTVERESVTVWNPTAMYAVLDDAKGVGAHARLGHMPEALQISRDPRSELVFTWPAGAVEAEAKVRVYRLAMVK